MARVSVFGLGYVGAVTAACLADAGHQMVGVDVNPAKVGMMESGRAPVLEPRLEELVEKGRRTCRLRATTNAFSAVHQSDVSFICVVTPTFHSGRLNPSIVPPRLQ